jgi:hypothetical protein
VPFVAGILMRKGNPCQVKTEGKHGFIFDKNMTEVFSSGGGNAKIPWVIV